MISDLGARSYCYVVILITPSSPMPSRIGFHHALRGLRSVWKEERNFRIQMVSALLILLVGWAMSFTVAEFFAVCMMICLVLGAEILNTIVEDAFDLLHPSNHATVGKIKDMAAGLVLVQSIGAFAVGTVILLRHVF